MSGWLLLATTPVLGVVPAVASPAWKELSREEQRILAPLKDEWEHMDSFRRKKWLGIAKRYPGLGAEEQARLQRRMSDWARLSPEERKAAREKYKKLQKAPPEKKESVKQKWQEYKELPDSEKARLQAEAAEKARASSTRRGTSAPPPSQRP